jgi:hypothetical protein
MSAIIIDGSPGLEPGRVERGRMAGGFPLNRAGWDYPWPANGLSQNPPRVCCSPYSGSCFSGGVGPRSVAR